MLDIEVPNVESPRLRTAGKDLLSLALIDTRNHTLRWFAVLEKLLGATLEVARSPQRSPPRWTLGHLGWFQERWVGRNVQRDRGRRCDPELPRLASIVADADRWYDHQQAPNASRWRLDLPNLQSTRQYLVETLETTLELLDTTRRDDDDALYFYRLALFHEDDHLEEIAVLAQGLGLDVTTLLAPLATLASRPALLFPATRWMLGSAPRGFVPDNEMAAHEIAVPEFEIDSQAVSWAQFCEFVEDGGYDEAHFWSRAGWDWVQREGRRTPRHVDQMRHGVLQQRFGRLARVPLSQPAVHLSWFEADAWCRWAGRRLPSEVEWEVAAHQGASRGLRWGEVWEWTGSTWGRYPGFEAGPERDRSAWSNDRHKVMRGASFATRGRLRHPKLRSFRLPEYDEGFVGFRSCAL